MKRYIVLGIVLSLGLPVLAFAAVPDTSTAQAASTPTATPTPETPEERAYKVEKLKLSDAISQKIAQIKAKQKEIDTEIYPAYQPPLMAEKAQLESELQDLEMASTKLDAEKTAKDLLKELKKP
jgi:hypothetical protein